MEGKSKDRDDLMKSLLEEQGLEMPAPDFTEAIMNRIVAEQAPVKPEKPIISMKAWFCVAVVVVLIVYLSAGDAKTAESALFDWKWTMPDIDLKGSFSKPFMLLFSISLWILFGIDYYFSSKMKIR